MMEASVEDQAFKHGPLNRDNDEIQLIALQPSPPSPYFTAPIKCKITHVKFTDRPCYEALSYMCGSSEKPNSITIEGKLYQIGRNLWLALQQLRLGTKPRVL
jgi:hypothetical protein